MRVCTLFLLAAVGCGAADVEGVWVGDCELAGLGTSQTLSMRLDLGAEVDGLIEGVGTMSDGTYGDAPISIEGTADGHEIDLELVYDLGLPTGTGTTGTTTTTGTGTFTGFDDFMPTFGVQGKVKGDEIDGTCSVTVMGFGTNADLVLTRE